MKLEDQMVDLELSKKLKDLNVEQESLWYWVCIKLRANGFGSPVWTLLACRHKHNYDYMVEEYDDYVSAFTVAELGEMLPIAYRTCRTGTGKYLAYSSGDINGPEDFQITLSNTEANARAKMLIHLTKAKV